MRRHVWLAPIIGYRKIKINYFTQNSMAVELLEAGGSVPIDRLAWRKRRRNSMLTFVKQLALNFFN